MNEMNFTNIQLDAIRAYDTFNRSFPDSFDASILDDDYILDSTILADIDLDNFNRLQILQLDIDDELHTLTLIFIYTNNSLISLDLLADTCISHIDLTT